MHNLIGKYLKIYAAWEVHNVFSIIVLFHSFKKRKILFSLSKNNNLSIVKGNIS